MTRKSVTAVLLVACFVLLACAAFAFFSGDNVKPVISFSSGILNYSAGEDESILLSNVTASDNHDGDITSLIRIANIVPLADGRRASVSYVVKDSNNNTATASQIVNYTSDAEDGTAEGQAADSKIVTESKGSVSGAADSFSTSYATGASGASGTSGAANVSGTSGTANASGAASTSSASGTSEGSVPPEVSDISGTASVGAAESLSAAASSGNAAAASGSPTLVLSRTTETIGVNDTFSYENYIQSITDDTDSKISLYKNIQISGDYKTKKAGTYDLAFYVKDSAGNKSNVVNFTLIRR